MSDITLIEIKTLLSIGLPIAGVYLGKIVWEYYQEGRIEKIPVYTSTSSCQQHRDNCNLGGLKDTFATFKTQFETFKAETKLHQKDTDKRLNESSDEIRALRKDISEIKESSARTNALLETLIEKIKTREY